MSGIAAWLDALPDTEASTALTRSCGSTAWVEAMLARRPFGTDEKLYQVADEVWRSLAPDDWREAFGHHPRIGDRRPEAAAGTADWAREEQAGTAEAAAATLQALADGNRAYEERFGHVFLICATGLSAGTMLTELQARLGNSAEDELRIAAAEQAKITRLRLEKLGTA